MDLNKGKYNATMLDKEKINKQLKEVYGLVRGKIIDNVTKKCDTQVREKERGQAEGGGEGVFMAPHTP